MALSFVDISELRAFIPLLRGKREGERRGEERRGWGVRREDTESK